MNLNKWVGKFRKNIIIWIPIILRYMFIFKLTLPIFEAPFGIKDIILNIFMSIIILPILYVLFMFIYSLPLAFFDWLSWKERDSINEEDTWEDGKTYFFWRNYDTNILAAMFTWALIMTLMTMYVVIDFLKIPM